MLWLVRTAVAAYVLAILLAVVAGTIYLLDASPFAATFARTGLVGAALSIVLGGIAAVIELRRYP